MLALRHHTVPLLTFATVASMTLARAQAPGIDLANWGAVTAPVFGSAEKAPYAAAELFAGPNKFGSYYAGVLPNGRIVKPAGTSVQVGMNPLGLALTPDGKFLITSNDRRAGGRGHRGGGADS